MLKSTSVVIGSYLLSMLLVIGTDPLVSRLFPGEFVKGAISSNRALFASTAMFVAISILCAWICARLAPSRAGRHVFWFFVIGEVLGIATTIPAWNKGWPHWYFLSWLLSWPVSCWIGLALGRRRTMKEAPAISARS
jgi:hypothetical protein